MKENQQTQTTPKSFILSQENLNNLVQYVQTLAWPIANPIMKFVESAFFVVEKEDADRLIEETKQKIELNNQNSSIVEKSSSKKAAVK